MTLVKKILVILGLCAALVVLPTTTLGNAILLNDERFLEAEITIGKTFEEIAKEIGTPPEKNGCTVKTFREAGELIVKGKGWSYKLIQEDSSAFLHVCFVNGYVVAEKRITKSVEGEQELRVESMLIDHLELKNALERDPDLPTWVDPDGPKV